MPASHFTSPSDPHRWLRRNRYQEGPDFLFLATQNGPPPEKRPSRGLLAGVRLRMRAVRLAKESGVASAVGFTGCSRASIYRWIQAFEKGGITALVEDSRRPQHLRTTVPNWVDTVIIAIRLNTYWNSKRIAAEMARREIYRVSAKHIDRLFHQLGCSRGSVPPQAGPRYERSTPNELWHIDIKGPFFINVEGASYLKTWIMGLVDDHSRFVLGLRIHTDAKLAPLLQWLDDCCELWGQPIELMTDNGSPFVRFLPGLLPTGFCHRLSGTLGWLTPAERYDGTPFTDRGFENIPSLANLQKWLAMTMAAA